MKIKIVSDLHLEFFGFELPNTDADVLILSGDILVVDGCKHNLRYQQFFEQINRDYSVIVYIPGNHEHYHGNIDKTDEKIKEFLEDYSNVHYLNNNWMNINGVAFIGTTLWSDINKGNPVSLWHVKNAMNDFIYVRSGSFNLQYSPDDWVANHFKAVNYIANVYDEIHQKYEKIVVCGHHAPSLQSIHPQYKSDIHVNGCYASDLDNFIINRDRISLWTHGHMHGSSDYYIEKTRVVCNPRGYANIKGNENPQFDPNKIVEI